MAISQVIENDSLSCWIEDNILYQVFLKSNIDLEMAKQAIEAKFAVCNGKDYPAFVDVRVIKNATREAREYFSGEKGAKYISVAAILAPTLISKLIGNFFITFNRPPVKIKLFTDKEEALNWLHENMPKVI